MFKLIKGENKICVMYFQDNKLYEVKRIKDVEGNPELGDVWLIQADDTVQISVLPIHIDVKLNKTGKTVYSKTIYINAFNRVSLNPNEILIGLKKVVNVISTVCSQISLATGRRINWLEQNVFEIFVECPIDISILVKECVAVIEKEKHYAAKSFWDMF